LTCCLLTENDWWELWWSGAVLGLATMKLIEFSVRGEAKRGASKTITTDFRRADFGLFRTLRHSPVKRVVEDW